MKIIGQARSIRQELLYSVGEWRIGEPKSKSGYRTIPLTDEAIDILKRQKEKNKKIKIISIEAKNAYEFICSHYRGGKAKGNRIGSGCP